MGKLNSSSNNKAMKEIKGRAEVIELVDAFYDKVNKDELLAPLFNQVAAVDWEEHLPKMYNFWESLLFGTMSYKGKPFDHHLPLPLTVKHFQRVSLNGNNRCPTRQLAWP